MESEDSKRIQMSCNGPTPVTFLQGISNYAQNWVSFAMQLTFFCIRQFTDATVPATANKHMHLQQQ